MKFERAEITQEARADANDEITQFKDIIGALRDELESNKIMFEENTQELERLDRDEKDQLKQTINVLRNQLEKYDAKKQ